MHAVTQLAIYIGILILKGLRIQGIILSVVSCECLGNVYNYYAHIHEVRSMISTTKVSTKEPGRPTVQCGSHS